MVQDLAITAVFALGFVLCVATFAWLRSRTAVWIDERRRAETDLRLQMAAEAQRVEERRMWEVENWCRSCDGGGVARNTWNAPCETCGATGGRHVRKEGR